MFTMNKKIFLLLIPLLFISSCVLSFNFTKNYTLITTGTGGYFADRYFAYDFNNTWYVAKLHRDAPSSQSVIYAVEFDDDFTNLRQTEINMCGTEPCIGNTFDVMDCKYYKGVYDYFNCLGMDWKTPQSYQKSITQFILNNKTSIIKSTWDSIYINEFKNVSACNDVPITAWKKIDSDTDLYYTKTQTINNGNGDGIIDIPTTYHTPDDFQLAFCGGALHVIISKNDGIFDLIYDYNSLNYKNVYSFSLAGWKVKENDFGVYVDNNTLFIVSVNNTMSDQLLNIQSWSCEPNYKLSNIYSITLNQNTIDSDVNGTYNMSKPFLTKDKNGIFHLFYVTKYPNYQKLKVSIDYTCSCSSWSATSECNQNYRKYNRTCYPEGCESNTTYWNYEPSFCQQTCEPAWVCLDDDTKAYRNLDCSYLSQTDCTGGTPYCMNGECVVGCTRGYTCIDSVTQAFVDTNCMQSEVINCNSTGSGYCYDGRCYEILTPAFTEETSVLGILESATTGVKALLGWISLPLFRILLVIAIVLLIMGIFGLLVTVAKKTVGR